MNIWKITTLALLLLIILLSLMVFFQFKKQDILGLEISPTQLNEISENFEGDILICYMKDNKCVKFTKLNGDRSKK